MTSWHLPAAALGFGGGCLLAAGRPPAVPLGLLLILAGGALFGVALRRKRRRPNLSTRLLVNAALLPSEHDTPEPRARILAAAGLGAPAPRPLHLAPIVPMFVAAIAGGAGWALVRAPPPLGSLEGRHVRFQATAVSDVRREDWGWTLELSLDHLSVDGRPVEAHPRVWASGSPPAPAVTAGRSVAGTGTIEALPRPAEDFDAYLVGKGMTARLEVSELTTRGPPENLALRAANAVRDAYRGGVMTTLPPRLGGLLRGLAIGDTEGMDPEVEEDFQATGLTHLLAVSGSNVALVLVPAMALAARLRLGSGPRALAGLLAVALFALVTRWEPSVLRAGAMAAIGLAGLWSGRPRRVGAALAVAVIVLLAVDPLLATSVGFQLSVAATASLAGLAGPVARRLTWLPRPVAGVAAATIAAQVGVTPLLLLRFGTVPTVTFLANVLAFPAVGAALLLGSVGAAVVPAWPQAGQAVGELAGLPLGYLAEVADRMARLALPSVTGGVGAAAIAGVLAMFVAWRLRRGVARTSLAGVAVAAAVAWSSAPTAGPPPSLTVTFLDVGQGDAAVVRTPDGATVLIDAGPEERAVAASLAALGIRRLDVAVASHAHADHIEGFPAVLARFSVGLLLEPGCPSDSPSYARFVRAIRDEEVLVRHPRGGRSFTVGRLRMEVLGPDRCSPGGSAPNDDSVVLRLTHGRATVLFPGDAEVPAQEDLLSDGDPLHATVLKVPHHGGDTSTPAFFDAVEATMAVVSTGPNDYGHPDPGVLAALRSEGMVVYRTDHAGDVTVTFAEDGSPVVASFR
jgi:competence protein ComEC